MIIIKKYVYILMIIIINNSNRNPYIKHFIKSEKAMLSKIKTVPPPIKKTCKVIKPGQGKRSKRHCIKFVTDYLIRFLEERNIKYKNIYTTDQLIDIIKSGVDVKGVIISGSDLRFKVHNIPYKLLLPSILAIEYFKDKPIFGICFGFQLINHYFGGDMGKAINFLDKEYDIKIKTPGWFFNKSHNGNFKFYNGDVVTKPGKGFIDNSYQYNEWGVSPLVEHKKLKIIGTQFHPELSGKVGAKILTDFLALCK
jgi:GMP synthase-like glutamine amidotransferase